LELLKNCENVKYIKNFEKEIKNQEKKIGIELSEKQFEAIKQVNDNNISIITGGPGTGKTTIIKTVINIYKSLGKKTILCAPTGRAAKRMTEATGEEAKTLHRLLEIGKTVEEKPNPNMNVSPIDADIVIIDEMSMVDLFLMNYVLNGIFKGTKLVLVGDIDQLPSVGPGNVLQDLIESKKVPYIALNKIFRQAAKSKIIVNSHKVNEGINFIGEINQEEDTIDDFEFISDSNKKINIYTINEEKLKEIHQALSKNQINYTNYSDSSIEGTINVENNQIIFTSIPYDSSWQITIDGKKVKPIMVLDSLLGIEVEAGDHTIKLQYKNNFIIPIIISLTTFLFLIISIIKSRKKDIINN